MDQTGEREPERERAQTAESPGDTPLTEAPRSSRQARGGGDRDLQDGADVTAGIAGTLERIAQSLEAIAGLLARQAAGRPARQGPEFRRFRRGDAQGRGYGEAPRGESGEAPRGGYGEPSRRGYGGGPRRGDREWQRRGGPRRPR